MHLLSAVVSLALLTSAATAAVVQHCVAFEGPMAGFTPLLEIRSHDLNTTVMVNHFEDIDKSLTQDMIIDVRQPVASSKFPVIESENGIKFKEPAIVRRHHYNSLHTALAPGESTSFSIEATGVYCVHVFQDIDDSQVHGVDILASHLYGDIPMTNYLWAKLVPFVALVYLFHAYTVPHLFPRMHPAHITESFPRTLLHAFIGRVFVIMFMNQLFPFVVEVWMGEKGLLDYYHELQTPEILFSEFIAVLVVSVVYKFILGLFGYGGAADVFRTIPYQHPLLMVVASPLQWFTGLLYAVLITFSHEYRLYQDVLLIILASLYAACESMNTSARYSEEVVMNDVEKLERPPRMFCHGLSLVTILTASLIFYLGYGAYIILNWEDITSELHGDPVWVYWLYQTSGPTPHQWLITLCMAGNLFFGMTPLSSFFCMSNSSL